VKNAALAMMGTSLLVFPVAAQQVAINAPDFSACDQMRATSPAKAVQCRVEVLQAHGAAADVRLAASEARMPCIDYLKAQKAAGKTFDRVITKENVCAVARSMGMHP